MSGKKKGLSHDEKRKRMCDFFYEKKEVMTLKELEKHLPKAKGIVAQTVKDVLQSLVDDGLVDSDKIGAGNFFWALPSKALSFKQNRIKSLTDETELFSNDISRITVEAEELESERQESDERRELETSLESLHMQLNEVNAKLAAYDDRNPAKLQELEKKVVEARDSVNRWTDNIFSICSYITSKNASIDQATLLQQFGLPADMDNVE